MPKPADKALIMREARDYLTRPSRDLAMVCTLAGVDMGAVIEAMRKQLARVLNSVELAKRALIDSNDNQLNVDFDAVHA